MLPSRKDRLLQAFWCPQYLFTDIKSKKNNCKHSGFLPARSPSGSGTESKLPVISIPETGWLLPEEADLVWQRCS